MTHKLTTALMAILFLAVVFNGCKKSDDDDTTASTGTCTDGIQNQGETGVDCGGPCANACATCTDGIQNQGETDVDCGGPCDACPSFTALIAGSGFSATTYFVDSTSVSGTTGYRIYGTTTSSGAIDIYINAVNASHTIAVGTEYDLAALPAGVTVPIMKYINPIGTPFQAFNVGKLKFTSLDKTKGKASGTFSFNGINGTTIAVTNGVFTNAPWN